ncbi:unnamed protein product [Staurois parvus]|uniref:Uncharacterized protein n=1 Tax=Staurois parvus TaxID=386267 RepID=A0ABN9ADQ2_9NEOB|nr:unnamed protein product [Staurois parvus]
MGPLCPCPNSKKPMKKYQGHLTGPTIDPGPSKWSFCPWGQMQHQIDAVSGAD